MASVLWLSRPSSSTAQVRLICVLECPWISFLQFPSVTFTSWTTAQPSPQNGVKNVKRRWGVSLYTCPGSKLPKLQSFIRFGDLLSNQASEFFRLQSVLQPPDAVLPSMLLPHGVIVATPNVAVFIAGICANLLLQSFLTRLRPETSEKSNAFSRAACPLTLRFCNLVSF